MMKKTRDDDDTDVLLLPLSSREMRQCPVRAENLHRYFPVTELPPDDDRDEEKDDMNVRGKMVCTDVCNSWWILQGSQHQHQHSDGNHLTSYYHEIEVLHKTGFFGNLSHKKKDFLLRPFMQDQRFNISVTLMFLKKKKTLRSVDFLLPAAHWEAFPPVHTGWHFGKSDRLSWS